MKSFKAQLRVGVMVTVGALSLLACGDAEETAEDRDSITDRKDAARDRDAGKKAGDAGKKDAGAGRSTASRDSGSAAPSDDESDESDESKKDDGNEGADEADEVDPPATTGSKGDDAKAADASTGATSGPDAAMTGAGEVVTTDMGTKIYLDPTCPNMMPMVAGMALDLIGCCLEGMCGLSTHKLMIPPQFAAMFPTACRGYEALSMITADKPEDKACSAGK